MPIILLVHRYLFYLEKIALQNGINAVLSIYFLVALMLWLPFPKTSDREQDKAVKTEQMPTLMRKQMLTAQTVKPL